MKKENTDTEVAWLSQHVKEDLPFPEVYYPSFYGTFISFGKPNSGQRYLCECSRQAVMNCLLLTGNFDGETIQPSDWKFGPHFSNYYYKKLRHKPKKVAEVFQFLPNLCHRCNHKIPSLTWCKKMYGNKFVQRFNWYIYQTSLHLGYFNLNYVPGICPPDIAIKIDLISKVAAGREADEIRFEELYGNQPFDLEEQFLDFVPSFTFEEGKLADAYEKELKKLPEMLTRQEFSTWYKP